MIFLSTFVKIFLDVLKSVQTVRNLCVLPLILLLLSSIRMISLNLETGVLLMVIFETSWALGVSMLATIVLSEKPLRALVSIHLFVFIQAHLLPLS